MTMRMAGISGMFDTESMVTQTLQPYKLKVTNKVKERDLFQLKQTQYRDITSKLTGFYNKYFKTGSTGLLSSSNYQAIGFTSSDSGKVTAKAGSTAILDNYKISVKQVATAATATIDKSNFLNSDGTIMSGKSIVVNGQAITLTGANTTEMVNNLNSELTQKGIAVNAKYTDFAGSGSNVSALVLQSKTLGKNGAFSVGTLFDTSTNIASVTQPGINAIAAKAEFNLSDLTIPGTININGADIQYTTNNPDDIVKNISQTISDLSLGLSVKFDTVTSKFTVQNTDPEYGANVVIGGVANVATGQIDAKKTVAQLDLSTIGIDATSREILINGKSVKFATTDDDKSKMLTTLNSQIASLGLEAIDDSGNNIKLIAKTAGESSINVYKQSGTGGSITAAMAPMTAGQDSDVTIENSTGGKYHHTGGTNNLTLDGVSFTFIQSTYTNPADSTTNTPITLTGKKDATALKDKIVNFVKDYNELITNLNTKLSEKRYKTYMPLSSEEKKDMNDDDIKLWNERVNLGIVRKDTDIQRIVDSMKGSMRTMMSNTGLKLEDIGITPVDDYKTLDGTFEIDDAKLTTALENNMDGVKELFLKESSGNTNYQDGGIVTNLKATLYKEVINYNTSALIKKAGYAGSVSDEMSLQLSKMQTKIDDMNTDLTTRENALYTKYGRLEAAMSKLQAQQSKLSAQFG